MTNTKNNETVKMLEIIGKTCGTHRHMEFGPTTGDPISEMCCGKAEAR